MRVTTSAGYSTDGGPPALVFVGRLTEDDAVNLNRCYRRLVRRSDFWINLGLLFLAAVGLLVVAPGLRIVSLWLTAAFIAGSVFLIVCGLYLTPPAYDWRVRRAYRRKAEEYLETQVTLTPDKVGMENDDHRSEFRWKLVEVVVDSPAGLLFCNKNRQALFWLPDRIFEGGHLRQRVLALAERNAVRVQSQS